LLSKNSGSSELVVENTLSVREFKPDSMVETGSIPKDPKQPQGRPSRA
jgi:hypothetical protein